MGEGHRKSLLYLSIHLPTADAVHLYHTVAIIRMPCGSRRVCTLYRHIAHRRAYSRVFGAPGQDCKDLIARVRKPSVVFTTYRFIAFITVKLRSHYWNAYEAFDLLQYTIKFIINALHSYSPLPAVINSFI